MPFGAEPLILTEDERRELQQMGQSRTLPAGDVMRSRMILLLADGVSYQKIQDSLDTTAPTIARWKNRFLQHRISGLMEERHPGQQPSVRTPKLQAKVLAAIKEGPRDGSTHWSCRKLASHFHVSKDTVQRILAQADVRPHRLERYMASDDPDFETKAADVIGLYLTPPQHAVVFCVDEKTAIQALDRLDPVLPLSPGRLERHGFEYKRNGTLSLYAALDVKTGKVQGKTAERHTSAEFVSFLEDVIAGCNPRQEIHIILDNLSAHKTNQVEEFSSETPM
jgi:transposase